jgi:hypothetical protein
MKVVLYSVIPLRSKDEELFAKSGAEKLHTQIDSISDHLCLRKIFANGLNKISIATEMWFPLFQPSI